MAAGNPSVIEVKLVVVGDGCVGKTSLLLSYARNEFPKNHDPTVFECITTDLYKYDSHIKLNLWDTAGQEDYDRLRPLSYHKVDIFLLCFSLVKPTSLENVKEKWVKELRENSHSPILLVGLKSDLRPEAKNSKQEFVTHKKGAEMASVIGAKSYLECSALTQEGVNKVFEEALDIVLNPRKKLRTCAILS